MSDEMRLEIEALDRLARRVEQWDWTFDTMVDLAMSDREQNDEAAESAGRRLAHLRHMVWTEGKPLNDAQRAQVGLALDDLEVRR